MSHSFRDPRPHSWRGSPTHLATLASSLPRPPSRVCLFLCVCNLCTSQPISTWFSIGMAWWSTRPKAASLNTRARARFLPTWIHLHLPCRAHSATCLCSSVFAPCALLNRLLRGSLMAWWSIWLQFVSVALILPPLPPRSTPQAQSTHSSSRHLAALASSLPRPLSCVRVLFLCAPYALLTTSCAALLHWRGGALGRSL